MKSEKQKRLSIKDKKEIRSWIEENSCRCIDEFSEYQNCCGAGLDMFYLLNNFCSFVKVRPRFGDLEKDQQNKIIELSKELGVFGD